MARLRPCRRGYAAAAALLLLLAAVGTIIHQPAVLRGLQQAFLPATNPRSIPELSTFSTAYNSSTALSNDLVAANRSFVIDEDQFWRDGHPFRILSGSIHYHRIPPDLWRDRLLRIKALGLNAVQLYVPWNFHQPTPGSAGILPFTGWRDLPGFIRLAQELDLLVLLRPGPYICAEWEFGGFPAWLLAQNTTIKLRSSDADYLAHVDMWWGALLPLLTNLTYDKGGPIIMAQIENEYGYYGGDKQYLRHLATLARRHLGQQVILYTVDGAATLPLAMGSLPGGDVLTTVDFGPGTNVDDAFKLQKRFNPPGKSPPFCVEYYTGWLTHWGEPMAHITAEAVANTLNDIVTYQNNTCSVNLYMAHGGTNFGPWAGTNVFDSLVKPQRQQQQQVMGLQRRQQQQQALMDSFVKDVGFKGEDGFARVPGPELWRLRNLALTQQQQQQPGSSKEKGAREIFTPHITSYDYNCPIGEAGDTDNNSTAASSSSSGSSKFAAVRAVLAAARDVDPDQLPDLPPAVPVVSYNNITLSEGLYVMDALDQLSSSCSIWGSSSGYCSSSLISAQRSTSGNIGHHDRGEQRSDLADQDLSRSQKESDGDSRTRSDSAAARSALDHSPDQQLTHRQIRSLHKHPLTSAVRSESAFPLPMEQYGQYYGLIVYETDLEPAAAAAGGLLEVTAHDTVWAFLDGQLVGRSYRGAPAPIQIPATQFSSSSSSHRNAAKNQQQATAKTPVAAAAAEGLAAARKLLGPVNSAASSSSSSSSSSNSNSNNDAQGHVLRLLVWPFGRNNFAAFGGRMEDPKGIVSNVTLVTANNNTVLTGWRVHHLCLSGGGGLEFEPQDSQKSGFGVLGLPWRPLVVADGASDGGGGAGMHWQKGSGTAGSSSSSNSNSRKAGQQTKPLLLPPQQQHEASSPPPAATATKPQSNAGISSSIGSFIHADRGLIATVAEAQAQAIIAAAAEVGGSGAAAAAARGVANIISGLAAEAAADASLTVQGYMPGPLLLRGSLHVPAAAAAAGNSSRSNGSDSDLSSDRPADTFLVFGGGWGRGEVWVNGFHLGRYWADQGPQITLFCPGSFLKPGILNEVVILELDGKVPVNAGQGLVVRTSSVADFSGPKGGPAPLN